MTEPEPRAEVVRHVPPSAAVAATSLIEMGDSEFQRMKGIASALAQAGVFKDATQAPIVFAKMVIGRELGLGIAQSMTGLHLVEGNVSMHYSTMLASVRAHGWKYQIAEQTEERCRIDWYEPGTDQRTDEPTGSTEFTMEDALKAGIVVRKADGSLQTPRGKSSNYQKIPKTMLLARCVSNGVRAWVPEALGGMPVYVTGEIEASEEVVDGLPGGSAPADDPDLHDVLSVVADEAVRERILQAYLHARNARPGQLSAAVIQMSVAGQPPEAVAAYADRLEAENARAEEAASSEPQEGDGVTDAEVVGEEEFEAEPGVDVEALRQRLSGLLDRQAAADPEGREAEEVAEEVERVEAALRDAGATVPGQEAMPI